MCFGAPSPSKDNSAEIARQQEAQRAARVASGRSEIDQVFSKYDDPYFQRVEKDYTNYYTPQLEDQYNQARRKVTLGLANSGNLNSGSGARTLADLFKRFQTQNTQVANSAIDAANSFRGDVEGARSDLYAQNRGAADPSAAAANALARVGSLAPTQAYSPLTDVFAGFINQAANAVTAEKAGYRGWDTGLFNSSSKSGRERTVS